MQCRPQPQGDGRQQDEHPRAKQLQDVSRLAVELVQTHDEAQMRAVLQALYQLRIVIVQVKAVGFERMRPESCVGPAAVGGQQPSVPQNYFRFPNLRIGPKRSEDFLCPFRILEGHRRFCSDGNQLRVRLHDLPGATFQREALVEPQCYTRYGESQQRCAPQRERQFAANVLSLKQNHLRLRTTPFSTTSWVTSSIFI